MSHDKFLINVLHWNANGILNKIHELYDFMNDNFIHIACISETFLKQNIKLPSHPDFKVHRLDRDDRPKGGVVIIIRRNITHNLLPHPQTILIECIGVEINLDSGTKLQIYSVYMPGGTQHHPVKDFLAGDINKLTRNRTSYFVCGDLNARHRQWNCFAANQAGTILHNEYMKNNFLIYHPETHTHIPNDTNSNPSTIDLVISNGIHATSEMKCHTMSSDHKAVTFSIQTRGKYMKNPEFLSHDYRHADWDRYRGIIHYNISQSSLNFESVTTTNEIDHHIEKFDKLLNHARDRSVPLTYTQHHKLDIPDDLKNVIKVKNSFRRAWQRTRDPSLKSTINRLEKFIKRKLNEIRNSNWQNLLSNLQPSNQTVWKTARLLKSNIKIIPPLNDTNGKIHISSEEKAQLIASEFYKNHQNPLANNQPEFEEEINRTVFNSLNDKSLNHTIDYPDDDELVGIVRKLKNAKSPGVDKIKNILIKKLPARGRFYLLFLICACLKLSYFPVKWKHAKVIAIAKPGKNPSSASSYRPISLLCSISKILERVILTRINQFNNENQIIPPEQYGFRAKFSTTRQLHKVIGDARKALSEKDSMGIIFLDVEKAFDRVWHNGLLFKMIKLNFPHKIIKIVAAFLSHRTFHVEINGHKSQNYPIPFGVPQGAVLSPTLYNIFTHDIPKSFNTKLALFADDTAFYSISNKASNIDSALKFHARIIETYSNKWKITINSTKTQATFITKRRKLELPNPKIKLFGNDVSWQSESKYLGVYIDKSITLKPHMDYVIQRASCAISTLYPLINRKSKLDVRNKLLIYKLAIRPILTYACPATKGIAKTHLKKLQVVQNKMLRMILNAEFYEKTTNLHEIAKVPLINDYIDKLCDKFLLSLN